MLSKRTPIKRINTKTVEKRRVDTARRQALNRRREMERRRKMTQINAALNRLSKKFRRVNIPRNTFNVGTVTSGNDRYLSVRLSRKTIKELQDIYKKTWEQRVEYGGSIPFTLSNTRNYVRFSTPTVSTNQQLASVTPTQEDMTQYIVYHTHPVPEQNRTLFTYPSGTDFRTYISYYPTIQANLILEYQGYYIIDLIETNMNKPNPDEVVAEFNRFLSSREFQRVSVNWSNLEYFQTTPTQWKRAVNNYIDPIMRRKFGISVKYYTWDQLGEITLLDKNVIMNVG
jgi:hypothetical protein